MNLVSCIGHIIIHSFPPFRVSAESVNSEIPISSDVTIADIEEQPLPGNTTITCVHYRNNNTIIVMST